MAINLSRVDRLPSPDGGNDNIGPGMYETGVEDWTWDPGTGVPFGSLQERNFGAGFGAGKTPGPGGMFFFSLHLASVSQLSSCSVLNCSCYVITCI